MREREGRVTRGSETSREEQSRYFLWTAFDEYLSLTNPSQVRRGSHIVDTRDREKGIEASQSGSVGDLVRYLAYDPFRV